jgi:hypothetical protein
MAIDQKALQQTIATNRKLMGKNLWDLFINDESVGHAAYATRKFLGNPPKRIRRKINGKKWSLDKITALLQETRSTIRELRTCKYRRQHRRNSYINIYSMSRSYFFTGKWDERLNRPWKMEHWKTLRERMDQRIRQKLELLLSINYRLNSHGSVWFELHTDTASISINSHDDWDYYSKRSRCSKLYTSLRINVPAMWWINVYKQGLAEADGMLTLSAEHIHTEEQDGHVVKLHKAQWLVQKAGYQYKVQNGFIAHCHSALLDRNFFYHSPYPLDAIRIASKKGKGQYRTINQCLRKVKDAEIELLNPTLKDPWPVLLDRLLNDHKPTLTAIEHLRLVCRVKDARKTGSCEDGIHQWCVINHLPYEDREAPFLNVLEAYKRNPRPEARLALRHALKRSLPKAKTNKLLEA